jgi:LCP family protein required for cell wall assembly
MRRRSILLTVGTLLLVCILAGGLFLLFLPGAQTSTQASAPTSDVAATVIAETVTAYAGEPNLPAPSATPAPTQAPVVVPTGGIPAPAESVPIPAGTVTVLLMGSDQRPNAGDFRTDVMLLIVIKKDGSVSLVSFPRDLWVYLPENFMQRINSAQEFGGFGLVQSTFEYNFGFAPQSFVLTNFNGFKSIVNSLGGIDVLVGQSLTDSRDGYPAGYTVDPGLVHMDGDTALWYVRSRKSTSDLDRLRRAQEMILAMGSKLFSLYGLTHIPDVYNAYRGAVVTDLSLQDAANLLPLLKSLKTDRIERYAISYDQVAPFVTSAGADVLLPRPEAVRQLLLQAFGN